MPVINLNGVTIQNMSGRKSLIESYSCITNMNSGTVIQNNQRLEEIYYGSIYAGNGTATGAELNLYSGCQIRNNSVKLYGLNNFTPSAVINMYGGEISGNTLYDTSYPLIGLLYNYGTINLYGGSISNNTGANSYGILSNYNLLNIYGGEISDNSSQVGAIFDGLGKTNGNNPTINIYGGTITGNTSTNSGGAIYLNKPACICNLYGGTFSNNTGGNGGAIYCGGTLNIAPEAIAYTENGVSKTSSGILSITGNTATNAGGAIAVNSTAVTIGGSNITISGNTSTNGKGDNLAIIAGNPVTVTSALGNSTIYYTLMSVTGANGAYTTGQAITGYATCNSGSAISEHFHLEQNDYMPVWGSSTAADYVTQEDIWVAESANVLYQAGNWNTASNWVLGTVPATNSDVTIAANATIPNGYTANAASINFVNSATLTLADGGQLVTPSAVTATVQKSITAYTSNDDGWNLIASPVTSNLVSAEVDGLIPTGETVYDLYYLDEDNTKWINYKTSEGNADPGFGIQPQKGYLYANSEGTTISFTGSLQPYVAEGVSVDLTKNGEGWNLVGNPFPFDAYANKPYYVINGRKVKAAVSGAIAPCTAIIVKADVAETVKFTKENPAASSPNQGNLNIVVMEQMATKDGSSVVEPIDNAIVSFDEGSQLEKFYFGNPNASIYIPQGSKDYAIAYSDRESDMPVNFKATKNGTYTLTVNTQGVEMAYLHLIDNMTGADVDLLPLCKGGRGDSNTQATYTFTAKTTDYASRFRLVFSICGDANGDNDGDNETPFAFVSNDNIVITADTQTATLQIVDVTGRVVVCTDVARNVSTTGMTAGVYVLRLINGNDVKTQKIVIP